jgi:hypothetical protein
MSFQYVELLPAKSNVTACGSSAAALTQENNTKSSSKLVRTHPVLIRGTAMSSVVIRNSQAHG